MSNPDAERPTTARDAASALDRAEEIARLFREHNRALVLFLASRLHDVHAAREVAQEAYVRVLELDSPGAIGFLRSYLFKVAANLAIDRIRQQQVRARLDPAENFENFLEASTAERTAIARDELAHIGRLIQELPAKYQQAFRLHRVEDRSFDDVAREMGLKERMVRRYVTHTLLYLRLRRDGVTATEAWRQVQA